MITWAVTTRIPDECKTVVICQGRDREAAKREAQPELLGDPDFYIVSPITRDKDLVVLKLTIGEGTNETRQLGW